MGKNIEGLHTILIGRPWDSSNF